MDAPSMDPWQVATNYAVFGVAVMSIGGYYWYTQQAPANDPRRRHEQDIRKQSTSKRETQVQPKEKEKKKPKAPKKQAAPVQEIPTVVVEQDEREEKQDQSDRQFAAQFTKARKGADLRTSTGKEQRQRTVKQSSAQDTPVQSSASSHGEPDADDETSPVSSPTIVAGGVADMLEPASKGPSTLRLTPAAQPEKQRVARQPKKEETESKKQRQNRQKKEEQRALREEQEKKRKVMEEKQRRAAREARGEPAKNGMARPPASNAWTAHKPVQQNGDSNGPLLDTFDAESSASSTGGLEASTAATSTTDADSLERRGNGHMSEDDQMALAIKQSEDESGWTTVEQPQKKKGKKVNGEASGSITPVEAPAVKAAAAKKNSKPSSFMALPVEDVADSAWEP